MDSANCFDGIFYLEQKEIINSSRYCEATTNKRRLMLLLVRCLRYSFWRVQSVYDVCWNYYVGNEARWHVSIYHVGGVNIPKYETI